MAGIFAGLVDTVAGGGGLVAVPVLLGIGMPPILVLGTNKMQGVIGEITAFSRFLRKNKLDIRKLRLGLCCVFLSALIGAMVVQKLDPALLNKIIPFLLLAVLLYTIINKNLGKDAFHARMGATAFYVVFGVGIGFYNGFFGPGTGSFWVFALMYFLGVTMQEATIQMKPLNLVGNVAALFYFMALHEVAYFIALIMAVGQIVGASLGTHIVLYKGRKMIKPIFIIVVGVMTIELFIKNV